MPGQPVSEVMVAASVTVAPAAEAVSVVVVPVGAMSSVRVGDEEVANIAGVRDEGRRVVVRAGRDVLELPVDLSVGHVERDALEQGVAVTELDQPVGVPSSEVTVALTVTVRPTAETSRSVVVVTAASDTVTVRTAEVDPAWNEPVGTNVAV